MYHCQCPCQNAPDVVMISDAQYKTRSCIYSTLKHDVCTTVLQPTHMNIASIVSHISNMLVLIAEVKLGHWLVLDAVVKAVLGLGLDFGLGRIKMASAHLIHFHNSI